MAGTTHGRTFALALGIVVATATAAAVPAAAVKAGHWPDDDHWTPPDDDMVPHPSPPAPPQPWHPPHWPHPWGPHPEPPHHYRDVDVFNLIEMIPAPAREVLCTLSPHGCPNLAVFESLKFKRNGTDVKQDMVAAAMSTFGLPAVVMTYFKDNVNFHRDWADPQKLLEDILDGSFEGAVDLHAHQWAMGLAFAEIVEFYDADGNGKYDPASGNDTVRSTYSLHSDAKWGPLVAYKTYEGNDTTLNLNVTTQDGVFGMRFQTAPTPHKNLEGVTLNPNATKVDVLIQNYPLSAAGKAAGNSQLALKTYVATGTSSEALAVHDENEILAGNGYLEWVKSVVTKDTTSGNNYRVAKVEAAVNAAGSSDMPFLGDSVIKSAFDVNGIVKADGEAKVAYFSFAAKNPSYVYWDPTLAYGDVPGTMPMAPTMLAGIIVGCVAGVGLFVAGGVWYRRRRARRASGEYLSIDGSAPSYGGTANA